MKRQTTYGRGFLRAAAPWASCAAVLGASGSATLATATFNAGASSAVVTHNSGGGPNTSGGVTISTGSASNTYGVGTPKKDKILFGGGTDSTTAKGGAGQTSSSSQALLLLPSGMGNDQVDSTSPFTGASFMVLDFTLVWDVSGSDFAPSNTAFNVTVGGTVGSGGSTKFEAVCQWNRKQGGTTVFNIRPAYTPAAATFATAGSYLFNFNSGPSAISVPVGWQLIMTGSIKMSADDPMDPSVMDFISRGNNSGIPGAPIDCGVVIVPDGADSAVSWGGQDGNWSDPALWTGNAGDVPFHPTDHVLLDQGNPASSHVALDMNASVSDVQLDAGDTLDVQPGNALGLFGPNPSSFAGNFSNNGTVTLLNGTTANVTGTGTHSGAFSIDAGSTLQFSGAAANLLAAGTSITGAGDLAITGGTLTLNGTSTHTGNTGVGNAATLVVGNADALGGGSPLSIAGGALVQTNPGLPKAISVASVATVSAGKFDLTNNAMVVRASTLGAVAAEIAKGAATTSAVSPGEIIAITAVDPSAEGIYSTTALNDPSGLTAIGFADNGVLGLASFHNVSPLTAADVLVALTYYGDADLTNTVTLIDFNKFVNGYVNPGTVVQTWLNGDFNYSGTVTLDDFNLFLNSYYHLGGSLSSLNSAIDGASGLSAADMAAMHSAVEAVPEPAGLGLLAVAGAAGLLRNGRRRR